MSSSCVRVGGDIDDPNRYPNIQQNILDDVDTKGGFKVRVPRNAVQIMRVEPILYDISHMIVYSDYHQGNGYSRLADGSQNVGNNFLSEDNLNALDRKRSINARTMLSPEQLKLLMNIQRDSTTDPSVIKKAIRFIKKTR